MWRRVILTAGVVLGAASVFGDLPDGEEVIDRLSAVFRRMRDLTADVEIHTPRRQASGDIVLQYVRRRSRDDNREEQVTRFAQGEPCLATCDVFSEIPNLAGD